MARIQIQKLHTLTGHRDCVYTLQMHQRPAVFFSGGGDGMVIQWDLTNPQEGNVIAKLPNSIYALCSLPEKDQLLVGHNFDGIHVLDCGKKKELGSLKITSSAIFDITVFGDRCYVASGDGSVTVVDYENLIIENRIQQSERSARTIAINPHENEMAVGYSDNFVRVFRLEDFSLKQEWMAHSNSVFTLAYSPDFKFLLSGSRDAHLKAWNSEENYGLHRDIAAHLYAVNHIAFSPDAKHFVTCSMDKSVKVWRTDDLTLLKVIDKARHAGHGTSVNKVLWSSFNNQLISASDDRTISVWDVIF
jgi:WD40 repeat protein